MDDSTIDFLRQVNNGFYARCAASFSATRNAPWHGWERCLQAARDAGAFDGPGDERAVRVMDVACGNMRFADFLREWLGDRAVEYYGVDHCDGLVPDIIAASSFEPHFQNVDIIGELMGEAQAIGACRKRNAATEGDVRGDGNGRRNAGIGLVASAGDNADENFGGVENQSLRMSGNVAAFRAGLSRAIDCQPCDFVGCFGFLHHVPSFDLRVRMLRALVGKTAPGGVACVSFWQFMGDARFAKKAQAWHEAALADLDAGGFDASQLEPGDYFLGWQNEPGLWRYCHNFDEIEVDALVAAAGADGAVEEAARFSADGKNGAMNRYVVLRKVRNGCDSNSF